MKNHPLQFLLNRRHLRLHHHNHHIESSSSSNWSNWRRQLSVSSSSSSSNSNQTASHNDIDDVLTQNIPNSADLMQDEQPDFLTWIPDTPYYTPFVETKGFLQEIMDSITDNMVGCFSGNIPLLIVFMSSLTKFITLPLQYRVIKYSEENKFLMPQYSELILQYRMASANGFNEKTLKCIARLREFQKENNFDPQKSMKPMLQQAPFHFTSFVLARMLSTRTDYNLLKTGPLTKHFLWCDSVKDRDYTYIMAIISASIQAVNIKISKVESKDSEVVEEFGKHKRLAVLIKKYSHLLPILIIPFSRVMPSGTLLYLVTTNTLNSLISLTCRYLVTNTNNDLNLLNHASKILKNFLRPARSTPMRIFGRLKEKRRHSRQTPVMTYSEKLEEDEEKFKRSGMGID
ncbi:MAG: hypothetical protein MHMPM18_000078 [Marteilia pararefringens]